MKFTSIQSLSPDLRTNAVFCLLFLIFFSLQTLISSVNLFPNDKTKSIWSNQPTFTTCKLENNQNGGSLKWFKTSPNNQQIPDNSMAPVYARDFVRSNKLMIMNATKKHSGTYECRHIKEDKVISSDKFELKVFNAIDMSESENRDLWVGIEGSTFSIPCFVRFDPDSNDATVTWRHNNHAIREKGDPQFGINNVHQQSVDVKKIRSTLTIKNLSKEHEGVYLCQAESGNMYLSAVETKEINLRVQFKPRFLDKNHKNVWISDESESEVIVNVTCMVNADPVATFQWMTSDGIPITAHQRNGRPISRMPEYNIIDTENMSVLSLKYSNLNQIRSNPQDPHYRRRNFKCVANNTIGNAKQDFIINIGKLPEAPILDSTSYENGFLWLSINQTEVKPPIDLYRVEINNNIPIYFNESNRVDPANNTYRIEVNVPTGTHQLTLYAHNPVGWSPSENPNPALKLVISGATVAQQYLTTLLLASALALLYSL